MKITSLAKKVIIAAISLSVAFSVAACAANNPPATSGTQPQGALPPSSYEIEEPDYDYLEEGLQSSNGFFENQSEFSAENSNLSVQVFANQESYSLEELIELHVRITNIGEEPITFIHGSGSNTVPDAIRFDLGGLANVYGPGIMTMDLQTHKLQPGETIEFATPFAPYIATVEFPHPVPPGQGIEFFADNEEFVRAEAGVIEGTLSFTFRVVDEEDEFAMIFVEDENVDTITVDFTIELA